MQVNVWRNNRRVIVKRNYLKLRHAYRYVYILYSLNVMRAEQCPVAFSRLAEAKALSAFAARIKTTKRVTFRKVHCDFNCDIHFKNKCLLNRATRGDSNIFVLVLVHFEKVCSSYHYKFAVGRILPHPYNY